MTSLLGMGKRLTAGRGRVTPVSIRIVSSRPLRLRAETRLHGPEGRRLGVAVSLMILVLTLWGCAGQQVAARYPEWFDPVDEGLECIEKPANCTVEIWSVWDEVKKRSGYQGSLSFLGTIEVSKERPHWGVQREVRFEDVPWDVRETARERACQLGADVLVYLEGIPGSALEISDVTVIPAQNYKWRAYRTAK
jgi:hypothetical protein